MEDNRKKTETTDLTSVGPKLVYEKPALSPLGHMAKVTQKSGAITVDNQIHPTRPN